MTSRDPQTDGGEVTKEQIFGTGDDTRTRITHRKRLRRFFDAYVLAPLRIASEDWRTVVGGLGVLGYLLMGSLGVILIPQPELNRGPRYLQPFQQWSFPLGTDNVGRSIFRRIVHATPAMLEMALAGILFAVVVAVIIGFVAGYKGGRIDEALMGLTDLQIIIPGLPLIMVLAAVYTPTNPFLVGAIVSIDNWPGLARAIRSQVLTLREEDYVESARAMGLSTPTIIRQELLPNIAPYILVNAAGAATFVINSSVALYFLNILPFNTLNWGVMINLAYSQGHAVSNPARAWHWLFFPLVVLSGLNFALILFSQGLDRVFNPRLRARHSNTTGGDES
ncbi:ABC transporter permease [Halarchaeum sp. P4]|uniref:ABC transporter permease n=1 Tax=Halarchaeum sp. P4 TaxID=3421639 RepID=UPI003EB71D67